MKLNLINIFGKKIKSFLKNLDQINRYNAVTYTELELKELKNIFALLIAGSMLGIPSAPVFISLELLPLMEDDLAVMFDRLDSSIDPIGEMFSIFDIG